MVSAFVLSQIFVSGAVICNLFSFQFKKREIVLGILTFSTVLVAGQLYFLDQMSAVYLTVYAVLYFLVSTQTTDRRLMWLFMAGGFAIYFATYTSYLDHFVIVSTVIILLSIFNDKQKQMRQLQMSGSLLRMVYYTLLFSPIGLLLEVALLGSNVSAYWRFYIKKQAV